MRALISQDVSMRGMQQQLVRDILGERRAQQRAAAAAREAELGREQQTALLNRRLQAQQEMAELGFDRDKQLLALRKAKTPEELDALEADIARQKALTAKTETETRILEETGGVKAAEAERLRLAQLREARAQRKEAAGIAEAEAATRDFILNPDTPRRSALAEAELQNQEGGSAFYFLNSGGLLGREFMDLFNIPAGIKYKGKPVTAAVLPEIAKEKGIDVEILVENLRGK